MCRTYYKQEKGWNVPKHDPNVIQAACKTSCTSGFDPGSSLLYIQYMYVQYGILSLYVFTRINAGLTFNN
jgi:hypothetical protein